MNVGSTKEKNPEKRISITPDTSKNLKDLGLVLFITYTLPLLLTSFEFKSLFFIDFSELFIFINFNYSGNVLLFHVLRQSTIGAERLDFRVRNGIGYNTLAIITGQGFISKN